MKKSWKGISKKLIPAISLLVAGLFLSSCSNASDGKSFLTNLDEVDSCIRMGQSGDALKLLKKIQKQAVSSYARIGVYKRYVTLGEKLLAEKVLKTGLSSLKNNLELTAVYTQFLLKNGRYDEALKLSSILEGTEYGSLYSESYIKTLPEEAFVLDGAVNPVFLNNDTVRIYYDAYDATGNEKWLINSVLPFLQAGDYAQAAQLQKSLDSKNAYFWALVHYDAGNFDICIDNLSMLDESQLNDKSTVLASDAYIRLGNENDAEDIRSKLLKLSDLEYQVKVPESVVVNSAIWSWKNQDYNRSYSLLMDLILKDSCNVPALVTYGKFAWEASRPVEMSSLEKALRKTELRTVEMEKLDSRPEFLISDALFRMDNAIQLQTEKNKEVNDELLVEGLSLYLKSNPELPLKSREAVLWKTLEKNERGTDLYPPKLVNFCVHELLSYGKTEEARQLFSKYLDARYLMNPKPDKNGDIKIDIFGGEKIVTAPVVPDYVTKAAFGDRAANYAKNMELWEVETAAYFAILDFNVNAAKRLYEYALFETGGVKALQKEGAKVISPLSAVSSAINLAVIYSSTGQLKESLSLYGNAAGKTNDNAVKSDILYRTALVQKDLNDLYGAMLSVDYSIALNPQNAQARLLKNQLK